MYTRIAAATGILICAAITSAQYSGQRPPHPQSGKAVLRVDPIAEPTSLDHLIRISPLIVDGAVISALPAIRTSQNPSVPTVETHSLVAVSTVLKGTVPNSSATVLVTQIGGKAGGWDVVADGDPLMAQGERYIFFLMRDERKEVPNASGMPRYSTVGVWSGKAKVINGKVEFLPRANPQLHKSDNTDVSQFIQIVKDKVNNPVIPTTPLPIHPPRPPAGRP